jgi:hypothetical protein
VIEDHLTHDINFIGGGEVVGFRQLWLGLLASCSIGGWRWGIRILLMTG